MVDLSLFKKVDGSRASRVNAGDKKVRLSAGKQKYITISSDAVKELRWEPGTRADMYKLGSTFAIKSSPVGTMTARGASSARTLTFFSISAYLTIAAEAKCKETGNYVFDTWIEDDVLFFNVSKDFKGAKDEQEQRSKA